MLSNMKGVSFLKLASVLAITMVVMKAVPAYGQISTPCNASVISSFTPCMNFLTNSTSNGASPTSDCCDSLMSLTSGGMDCLCLIITGSVPFRIPINRTLAISLPRACNMPGVPLQCKASGSPIPSPGSVSPGPSPSSGLTPSRSPDQASSVPQPITPALAPQSDTTPLLTPPSPTVQSESPAATTGSRPVLTPSSAVLSYSHPLCLLLVALGLGVLN